VLLDLMVTPGNGKLARIASLMLGGLRARSRSPMRVVLDAGAAQSHADLLRVADQNPNQVLLVRAPRRQAYLARWAALPTSAFSAHDEPGRYKGAAPKRIHIVETTTRIRALKNAPHREVRTIVIREEKRRGKDRWHAIFVFRDNATSPLELLHEFRARQHHEQSYRVLLHDAFVDTVPSGYNKKSKNPDRPGFRKNAITLYAWLAGLAVNAMTALTAELPKRFSLAPPRTLRRWWFNFPADVYSTESHLLVVLNPRWFRSWWERKVLELNRQNVRIPWMRDRLVRYSLSPLPHRRSEP
jgi:hypothetical protein